MWCTVRQSRDVLETSKNECQTPGRPLDTIHLQMEPSDINQRERISEARKTSQQMGRRHKFILTTNQSPPRRQRTHERPGLAHHGTRLLGMGLRGKRHCEQQTQTTNATHDPNRRDYDNQTNKKSDKQRRRLNPMIATKAAPTMRTTHCPSSPTNRKLILSIRPKQQQDQNNNNQQTSKTAIRAPATHSNVSEPHLVFQHRYRRTSLQVAGGLSRFS